MSEPFQNGDLLHVCEEMIKAINYACKKCPVLIFTIDVQRSMTELCRTIKFYKQKQQEEERRNGN